MKKGIPLFVAVVTLGLSLSFLPKAEAMMFRCLDMPALAQAAATHNSMCVKVRVTAVQDTDVTVDILDVIKTGPGTNVAAGSSKTFHFPSSTGFQTVNLPKTPAFAVGAVEVWCITQNARGDWIPVGGWEQARFYVTNIGGQETLYNSMGNSCLINYSSQNSAMKKAVQFVTEHNTSAFPIDAFKEGLNQ